MTDPATPAQSNGLAAAPAPRHALRLPSTPERPLDAWAQRRLVADARALVAGERRHAPTLDHLCALLAWLDGRAQPQHPHQRGEPQPPHRHRRERPCEHRPSA